MRDNSKTANNDFSSWNIKNEANRDTRHWDPQARQEIQGHFANYELLRSLEAFSQDDPETFKEIMRDNPNDPAAAAKALAKFNQSKGEQLRVKAGLQRPVAKQRKGWDALEINRSVRNLLNQK